MTLKPSQLIALLKSVFLRPEPSANVLVVGSPGIGKTEISRQVASDIGYDYIVSHPSVEDPTDSKGLPWIIDGVARFLPIGIIDRLCKATKPTIWSIEDMGQAPTAVQAVLMQWLLDRGVAGHKLSDQVRIMACTNDRSHGAGVSGLLETVKSRFATIVNLVCDVEDWTRHAIDAGLPPELIAYHRFTAGDRLAPTLRPTSDLVNFPCPRQWSRVGRVWLPLQLPDDLLAPALAGCVGEADATQFLAYLEMYRQLIHVDDVLANPGKCPIPTKPDQLYALCTALAARATVANFGKVAAFCNRLMGEGKGEYAVLTVRDSLQRTRELVQTADYVKLATGALGRLIAGN